MMTLQSVVQEVQKLRDEHARKETDFAAMLRQRDEELQRLRERIASSGLELQQLRERIADNGRQHEQQLSPSDNRTFRNSGENARGFADRGFADRVFADRGFAERGFADRGDALRAELGYKMKPDTYDGGAPLREFFSQFDLIASANCWSDSAKTVALAACLRGKARSVLECVESVNNLEFTELKSKLELRFGEGHLAQTYYSLFTNRKQKFGEEAAAFGADIERLARLAYPECPYAVRDKIACAQFVSSLSDGFVRRTLQLEGVTSLNIAVERAKAIKVIQGENFGRNGGKFNKNFSGDFKKKESDNVKGNNDSEGNTNKQKKIL